MTKGAFSGMNGWPRPLRVTVIWTAICFAYFIVNSGSTLIENPLPNRSFALWEPFVWEGSSNIVIIALLLPILWLYDRFRPERVGLVAFISIHSAAFLIMSLTHIAGMVALREFSYWAIAGWNYHFSQGNLPLQLIYEGRKDALAYLMMLGLLWIDARLNEPAPPADDRIELRDSGRTFYIDQADILFVEAAGNYVEVHTTKRTHLVRGTLSGFDRKLDDRFAQVHRSRIVNRTHISSLEPTASGDVKIRLDEGREVIVSRRFKAALKL